MKAVIFGCGGVGLQVKHLLEKEGTEIIAFSDNNEQKWGGFLEGKKIVPPPDAVRLPYDIIAVGVFKAADTIISQLLELGVVQDNIVIPIKPPRIFPNPNHTADELEALDRFEYDSANTKAYLEKNITIDDRMFLQKLDHLKQVLKENRIPRQKVCIVSGAVLQAYGLRKSKKFDDIDIIMTSDLREIYGTGLVIVSSTAEMHPQNEYKIKDDEIILNIQYHFVFHDLKFACLEVMEKNVDCQVKSGTCKSNV